MSADDEVLHYAASAIAALEGAEHYAQLIISHAIRNRVAYEAAEAEGLHVREVPTRSGREAAAEFQAFVDWFLETLFVKEAA